MTHAEQAALTKRLADLRVAMGNRSINAVNLTDLVRIVEDIVALLPVSEPEPVRTIAEPRGRA